MPRRVLHREFWMATGAVPRWQLVLVYLLVGCVAALGLKVTSDQADRAQATAKRTASLAREIQRQRVDNIRTACEDQNRRHDSTLASVDRALLIAFGQDRNALQTSDPARARALAKRAETASPRQLREMIASARQLAPLELRRRIDEQRAQFGLLLTASVPKQDCDKLVAQSTAKRG